ncbi:Ig-like domain-containing protein, partial [Colwelliaceae bacterium BS250]
TFIPSADLENDNVYEVSIGSAATSAREIKATSFDFSTAVAPVEPVVPITVTSHTPRHDATGVAINPSIEVNFSETIESSEVQATINVRNAQGAVAGSTV